MKKFNPVICYLILLLTSSLYANEKHLILAEGDTWLPMMPENLIENHSKIEALPFSGFVMVGNSYTNNVMKEDESITYDNVWSEVKGLKGLYKKKKHNFMQINIDFPGDFWDDKAWERVTNNFSNVAKVAKDLNFKGIVFDDEPYSNSAMKMVNFKFPNKIEVANNPNRYEAWQKNGSEDSWVDIKAYSNPEHTFQEHMDKVASRFKTIMQAMATNYPNITVMVYNGPSYAHNNTNRAQLILTDVGLAREHEYKGAIFAGFKEGDDKNTTLHDMGESYKYRMNKHFINAYQWRKHDIAKDEFNDDLNSNHQWKIPRAERSSWSNEVEVGFMVFNKGQKSNYSEYDTRNKSTLQDIKASLQKALKYSDKYVIYYPQEQNWLLPNQKYPLKKGWMEMMQEINNNK